jgi:hypothetical protein
MLRNIKIMLLALSILVLSGGFFAIAAANTVPDSDVGYSSRTVPGYSNTAPVIDNSTDPLIVDAITFSVSPNSGTVVAAIVKLQTSAGGPWTDCTLVAGVAPAMDATCTYGALLVADVTAITVVASSTVDP